MRRHVIAPTYRQASLFWADSVRGGWFAPDDVLKLYLRPEHLQGVRFNGGEVWWLDRLWPCHTPEDVGRMEGMMLYARIRGADLRRWYT